LLYLS